MSGSGSGGRIAVHISDVNHYRGALRAVGGLSSDKSSGGPGTVFVERKVGYDYHRRLIVDGNNASPAKPLVINERNPSTVFRNASELNNATFGFDDVVLTNKVCLRCTRSSGHTF